MDLDMDIRDDLGNQSDDPNGDGEGVWSPDIEQCFREALLLFPPCGRRKHILQEEGGGKMYGRNELIARHIMMRTGKRRTRKQVSSHIQVLARRKAKADAGGVSEGSAGVSPSPSNMLALGRPHSMSSANQPNSMVVVNNQQSSIINNNRLNDANQYDIWLDRPIVTQKIRLVEFSAFVEYNSNRQHNQFNPQQAPDGLQLTSDLNISNQQQQQQIEHTHMNHHLQSHALAPNGQHQQQQNYQQPLTSSHLHQQQQHHHLAGSQIQPQMSSSASSIRHSYIKINYAQQQSRQVNKLERIDINQIHDKFPEISGPDGLFQRGPPDAFFLIKFWADLNNDYEYNINDQNSFFGFSSRFETIDSYRDITCSTKACSYGIEVIEKVEKIYGCFNNLNGRYSYDMNRSPMCEFMIHFIRKLRQLPQASQMNSVLENFTVLQVITSESTSEILLCLAYVFEVAMDEQLAGPQYNVYKLTKD